MSTLKVNNITDLADDPIITDGVVVSTPGDNLIYNGAMQVAQRGTSITGVTTGSYLADRFIHIGAGSYGTWTNTIENDAPTGSGFSKSFKTLCTTSAALAAGANVLLQQRLEGQDLQQIKKGTSEAKKLTLSFWVKSNVTGTYIVRLGDIDNSRSVVASYTISGSGVWENKKITFPADTTGVLDNDNGLSLFVGWFLDAGTDFTSGTLQTSWGATVPANLAVGQVNLAAATSNYWQITGVQLETGEVASPFEHKPYGVELAECQRYYTRFTGGSIYSNIAAGHAPSTTAISATWNLPTSMRIEPTAVDFSNISFSDFVGALVVPSGLTIDSNNSGPDVVQLVGVVTGATQFRRYVLCNNNNVNGYVGVSAEL